MIHYFILTLQDSKYLQEYLIQLHQILPVAVIVVGIITSQSSEAAQADGIGEEDLGSCIHPYLKGT